METYCVSCKKNTANENSRVTKTEQNRLILLSNCTIYLWQGKISFYEK